MIDLRTKGLPNAIEVNGNSFLINTDFRTWIKFSEIIQKEDFVITDILFIFESDINVLYLLSNEQEFLNQILNFYTNPNVTPKSESNLQNTVVDYILDGEYIVGSFLQVYNIDLTQCDMHWHMFKALFLSLPEDCKISQIMQLRSYEKNNLSYERHCEKLKRAWSLPIQNSVDEELMQDINDEFYNC